MTVLRRKPEGGTLSSHQGTYQTSPTANGATQLMSVDEGSPVWALTVYQASLDEEFDVDLRDNTLNRGPKPIEELIKLQFRLEPGQCMQLSKDLTNH